MHLFQFFFLQCRCFSWDTQSSELDTSDTVTLEVRVIGLKEDIGPQSKKLRVSAKKAKRTASPKSEHEDNALKATFKMNKRTKVPQQTPGTEENPSKMMVTTNKSRITITEKKTKQTQFNFAGKQISPYNLEKEARLEQGRKFSLRKNDSKRGHKKMEVENISEAVTKLSDDKMKKRSKCLDMQTLNETTPQVRYLNNLAVKGFLQ